MRSVVLSENQENECGICEAKEPFIEYMELEGVRFILCHKCNTISFLKPIDDVTKYKIEKEMNIYQK